MKKKKLKMSYILKPFFNLKRESIQNNNYWNFLHLFDEYFCYCIGLDCLIQNNFKRCKYFFYIYLIDINSNVYKKTDYLLMDFILKNYTSDDVYPIYEEMIKMNLSSHYITEKREVYRKYCHNIKYCNLVIYANENTYKINDEFLEKHLNLILKLRQVLSSVGVDINFINNIFYNIDYITYICIGHGVSYFKPYLYEEYYGHSNFDKLLIPNSDKFISVAIKNGWKDENLIKYNLPKWEKYDSLKNKDNILVKSIFIMFTWREIKPFGKPSELYFKNILKILKNELLINNLFSHNITLYFSLHHQVFKYKKKFKSLKYMKHINFIDENNIGDCLSKTSLIVTDYSSIIFDMIYQRKPYIIYIPDIKDPLIKINYRENTYNVIKKFNLKLFDFKNIYFDVDSVIDKIYYYIHNDFKLEKRLSRFYDDFNLKNETSINEFINITMNII